MKKVPAISTSDSKAVLGWPRGLSCPGCPAVLLLSGPSVVAAQVILLLLLSASESLETEQPWRGCSWKIWKGITGPWAGRARLMLLSCSGTLAEATCLLETCLTRLRK